VVIWEFGAATIGYKVPIDAELSDLVTLSDLLWDNADLMRDARRRAEQLLNAIRPAVDKPEIGERIEDYVVFELRLPDGQPVSELWTTHAATTAKHLARGARAAVRSRDLRRPDDAVRVRARRGGAHRLVCRAARG
jgi:hypothetical protein